MREIRIPRFINDRVLESLCQQRRLAKPATLSQQFGVATALDDAPPLQHQGLVHAVQTSLAFGQQQGTPAQPLEYGFDHTRFGQGIQSSTGLVENRQLRIAQ